MQKLPVLLIDDEPFNLELMEDLVSEFDFSSQSVNSGSLALQELNLNPYGFCCILLDRMMPGMTGMALLLEIEKDTRFNFLPIIMQSAVGETGNLAESFEHGALYFLTKPFAFDALEFCLNNAHTHMQRRESLRLLLQTDIPSLQEQVSYEWGTFAQARVLAVQLAQYYAPNTPLSLSIALYELMNNALIHGSSKLDAKEEWQEHSSATTTLQSLSIVQKTDTIDFIFHHCDPSFDPQNILALAPSALNNYDVGRGLWISGRKVFSTIEKSSARTEIIAKFPLKNSLSI